MGPHKVLYYRSTKKMRELYITLTCLGFFFSFLFFSQNNSRKERCRRQMSQAPGLRSEGTGGDEDQAVPARTVMLRAGPGFSPSIWGELTALEGADKKRVGGQTAVPRSAAASLPWQSAGMEELEAPCLEARSPEHGPSGARQKGEAGRARRGL